MNFLIPDKKGYIFSVFFVLFILLIIYIWWRYNTSPLNQYKSPKQTFVISTGENISTIADRLQKDQLIKNSLAFKILIKLEKIEKNIQAGSFLLSPNMDLFNIAHALTKGSFDVWVTIPEGLRKEEVAEIINSKIPINQQSFINSSQEGYLFPDTYLIPKNYTAQDIIKLLTDNFNQKTKLLLKPLSKKDLIIASIVEREARQEKDRPLIAGILIKRSNNNWALEADATVQYALGYDSLHKTWWKKNLTIENLQIDSPFNTRKYASLPPQPISNPGLSALKAVLFPEDSPYWYYISDKSGNMHYAKTLEEHNINIQKFLSN